MNNINFTFHIVLLLTIIQKHTIFAASKNLLTITVINNHEVTIKSSEHLHLLIVTETIKLFSGHFKMVPNFAFCADKSK